MAIDDGAGLLPVAREARGLHAGFWRRLAAYLIDLLLVEFVWLVAFTIAFVARGADRPWTANDTLVFYLSDIALLWLYFALFESSRIGATLGKMALGLAVTDLYGRRIGFARATGRFFGKFLSALILDVGFMMAGWTARKQGLHDLMAGTCVVEKDGLERRRASNHTEAAVTPRTPRWVVVLIAFSGSAVAIAIIAIIAAIAIPEYLGYEARAQVSEAVALLLDATSATIRSRADTGIWPASISVVDPAAARVPAGRYTLALSLVDCQGATCGIRATMRQKSYVSDGIAGRTIEVWTPDGGQSWYCGPGPGKPVDATLLPANCRTSGAP